MTKTDGSLASTLDDVDFNNLLEAVSVPDASAPGLEQEHDALAVCGGKIGGSRFRFCTRLKHPNMNCCTTTKHRSQFHKLQHGCFYIIKNNNSAFTTPFGDMSKMTVEQIHNLSTARKTIDEWRNIFTLITSDQSDSATTVLSETNRKLKVISEKTSFKNSPKNQVRIPNRSWRRRFLF